MKTMFAMVFAVLIGFSFVGSSFAADEGASGTGSATAPAGGGEAKTDTKAEKAEKKAKKKKAKKAAKEQKQESTPPVGAQ